MASARTVVRLIDYVRRALGETFAPSRDATSRMVRVHGAVTIGLGVIGMIASGALSLALGRFGSWAVQLSMASSIVILPMFAFGGYRLILGAEPASEGNSVVASVRRISVAIVSIVLGGMIATAVMTGIGYAIGMK